MALTVKYISNPLIPNGYDVAYAQLGRNVATTAVVALGRDLTGFSVNSVSVSAYFIDYDRQGNVNELTPRETPTGVTLGTATCAITDIPMGHLTFSFGDDLYAGPLIKRPFGIVLLADISASGGDELQVPLILAVNEFSGRQPMADPSMPDPTEGRSDAQVRALARGVVKDYARLGGRLINGGDIQNASIGTPQIADDSVDTDKVNPYILNRVEAVKDGGDTGQVLAKRSGTNFDTEWQTVQSGGGLDRAAVISLIGNLRPNPYPNQNIAINPLAYEKDPEAFDLTSGHLATITHDTGVDLEGGDSNIQITASGLSGQAHISVDDLLAKPDVAPNVNLSVTNRLNDAIAFSLQSRQFYLAHDGDNLIISDGQVADQRTFTITVSGYRLQDFADRRKGTKVGYNDASFSDTGNVTFSNDNGAIQASADVGITIKDEGTTEGAPSSVDSINFVGTGVDVARTGNETTVTVTQAAPGAGEANPAAATQAESEAGTETALRSFSPVRIMQAFTAFLGRARFPWGRLDNVPNTASRFPTYAEVTGTKPPADAEANVNADWDATTGDAQILNKPVLREDVPSGTEFPNNPSEGDQFILLNEATETRDRYIIGRGFQNGTVVFNLGGHGGDATAIIAYDGNYATVALRGKVFVQYSGTVPAPAARFNTLYFYEPTGVRSDGTFTVNATPQSGFPHLFEVNNLHATALNDGAGYIVNLRNASGNERFAGIQHETGHYIYDTTNGWEYYPGQAASWATQGRPEPRTLLALTTLIDGPGPGISVSDPGSDTRTAGAPILYEPAFTLTDEDKQIGIAQTVARLRFAPGAASTYSFNASTTIREIQISGFTSATDLRGTPQYSATAENGVRVGAIIPIYDGATKRGDIKYIQTYNAANRAGDYLTYVSATSGGTAFSITSTVQSYFIHNDGADAPENFTQLEDTPSSYTGNAGRHIAVNSASNALEFSYRFQQITQAAYDALGTKDANTLYIIIG